MTEGLKASKLLTLSETIARDFFEGCTYPWGVLPNLHDFILSLGDKLPKNEYKKIKSDVWVSLDSEIWGSADISGPTIIQKGAQIRHCAFIRGSAIIGEGCVVGNSTEIKNSILFNFVQVPHYNYIGDSILGYKAHFGAGAITSNVKSDKSTVTVRTVDGLIDTKLKKFGAVVGDFCEIGCNTVLNPGTILCKNSTVYPLTMVRGVVPENSILKNNGEIVTKRPDI